MADEAGAPGAAPAPDAAVPPVPPEAAAQPRYTQEDFTRGEYIVGLAGPPGADPVPLPKGEPVFILRGTDKLAVDLMETYATRRAQAGDVPGCNAVRDLAVRFVTWQREHGT